MSRRLQRIARQARAYVEADQYAREIAALEAMQGRETISARCMMLHRAAEIERHKLSLSLDITPGTPSVSPAQLHIIRHALGHDPAAPRSGGYRNGYSSGPTSDLEALVAAGLMERCGERFWRVTEDGARTAGPSTLAAWRRERRS